MCVLFVYIYLYMYYGHTDFFHKNGEFIYQIFLCFLYKLYQCPSWFIYFTPLSRPQDNWPTDITTPWCLAADINLYVDKNDIIHFFTLPSIPTHNISSDKFLLWKSHCVIMANKYKWNNYVYNTIIMLYLITNRNKSTWNIPWLETNIFYHDNVFNFNY